MPGVFLSHAWIDRSPARVVGNPRRGLAAALRDHLTATGLDVFYDAEEIRELDDIERRIRDGLAGSTLFVCWYSDAYRERRACHWELTAALAADASRVVVVNPEDGVGHILPATLLGSRIAAARDEGDAAGWAELAQRIAARARSVGGTFGAVATPEATGWYGDPPARFAHFVGRAGQLWQLDSALRPQSVASGGARAPDAVVVHGLGGVGKTALACEYATRFAAAYRGGIFWLRAGSGGADGAVDGSTADGSAVDGGTADGSAVDGGTVDGGAVDGGALDGQLVALADQLHPVPPPHDEAAPVRSPEHARAVLRQALDASPQPFLWIVDDLPAGLTAAEFRRWLPPSRNGRTIVTSRGTTYRQVPNLFLDVMPPEEAVELLFAAAAGASGDTLSGDSARDSGLALAGRLGYLPLALEVVGALAAIPGAAPDLLLSELDEPADLVEEAAGNPYAGASVTEHPLSLATTFGPSISRLDPGSFWLLAAASAVNVGPLPVTVVGSVAQRAAGGATSVRTALGTLLSRSLARRIDDETFEVHGLVAGAVLRRLDRPDFAEVCATMAADRVCEVVGDADDISTHRASRRATEFGHALAARHPAFADAASELALLRYLGRYLHTEHRYQEAVAVERRAAALAERVLGEDAEAAITSRLNYALSLAHSGVRAEATQIIAECAQRLERLFGPDDLNVLTAKHNLAIRLVEADAQEARRLGLEVYHSRVRLFGPEHPHSLFSLHTLLSYNVVPPGYPDAVAAYEHLIEMRTRVLGADHTTTLTSIGNFVDRLVRIRAADRAVPLARGVLARRSDLYGPDHEATVKAWTTLLLALSGLRDPPEEEIEAIAVELERAPPTSALSTEQRVQALSNTAEALRRLDRIESALRLLSRARQLAVQSPGVSDRTALLVEHNLAATVAAGGDVASARTRYDDLVPDMERRLGTADRLTMRARRQRAILRTRLGEGGPALAEQLALVAHWRATAGPNSPEVAEALADVADTLDRLGRPSEADRYRSLRHDTGVGDDLGAAGFV